MKYKTYSKELKLEVVNEYLVIKKWKIHEIQAKYELSTPVLIYILENQYQAKGEQAFTKNLNYQTSHRMDKEDIKKTFKRKKWKIK